ncbi:MAG: energy-coupling factor transporter transmembrane component T [Lachnospira sp.]|nr:energy-coupling factor transporter transmembrane component T [Lachnospira sp.]
MSSKFLRLIEKIFFDDLHYQNRKAEQKAAGSLVLLSAFLCIVLCSLSSNPWFVSFILAALLLRLALMPPQQIANVLKVTFIGVGTAALLALPAVFMGSPRTFGTITMKTSESVMLLAIISEQLGWKGLAAAAAGLHLPDLFLLTLDTTVRYLHILGRFAARLSEALSLRQVGEKSWTTSGTGGIVGTTFLKAQRLSEQNAEAMTCRCFDGTYRRLGRHHVNGWDAAVLAADVGVVVLFVYLQMPFL